MRSARVGGRLAHLLCRSAAGGALAQSQGAGLAQQTLAGAAVGPGHGGLVLCGGPFPGLATAWSSRVSGEREIQSAAEDVASAPEQAVDMDLLIGQELKGIAERIRHIVKAEVPILAAAAEYFFRDGAEGKRVRASALLLIASSLSHSEPSPRMLEPDLAPYNDFPAEQRRRQQRIAEITEMIHVATLLHDDVLDDAEKRRGMAAVNVALGNKTAILAGDFLLARASVALASLRNTEVVELLAQVIEHLVTGELMQSTGDRGERISLDHYYRKTYCKTASLIANASKAVALLGGHDGKVAQLAWDYGHHLGMSFQLIDDILDFVGSSSLLGKPTLSDLRSGIATAPVLFACEEHPELLDLVERKFAGAGDVQVAASLVNQSQGIERTRQVAEEHCALAIKAVDSFPATSNANAHQCREALRHLVRKVQSRQK